MGWENVLIVGVKSTTKPWNELDRSFDSPYEQPPFILFHGINEAGESRVWHTSAVTYDYDDQDCDTPRFSNHLEVLLSVIKAPEEYEQLVREITAADFERGYSFEDYEELQGNVEYAQKRLLDLTHRGASLMSELKEQLRSKNELDSIEELEGIRDKLASILVGQVIRVDWRDNPEYWIGPARHFVPYKPSPLNDADEFAGAPKIDHIENWDWDRPDPWEMMVSRTQVALEMDEAAPEEWLPLYDPFEGVQLYTRPIGAYMADYAVKSEEDEKPITLSTLVVFMHPDVSFSVSTQKSYTHHQKIPLDIAQKLVTMNKFQLRMAEER